MKESTRTWNKLADHFDLRRKNPSPGVIANITETWHTLETFCPSSLKKSVLDFGCGTGALCEKLAELGHQVLGIDPSEKMIERAKEEKRYNIEYRVGSISSLKSEDLFNLITSMMVLQFIDDILPTLQVLSKHLKPEGIFWFSVHSPEYVNNSGRFTNI